MPYNTGPCTLQPYKVPEMAALEDSVNRGHPLLWTSASN